MSADLPRINDFYGIKSIFNVNNWQDGTENFFLHHRVGYLYIDKNCRLDIFLSGICSAADGNICSFQEICNASDRSFQVSEIN